MCRQREVGNLKLQEFLRGGSLPPFINHVHPIEMIEIKENSLEPPVCPHCEKVITTIHAQKIKTLLGVRFLYYCGECKKVLGVSHRKGFLMG